MDPRYTEQLNINLVPVAWPLAFATVRLTFGHAGRDRILFVGSALPISNPQPFQNSPLLYPLPILNSQFSIPSFSKPIDLG
ncbi:hypothetical protein BJP36_41770 [Moorena producens JHB]|uniref:Uncharacterized protein n=1 Tax=Moorena producens (strain JHB) TaxID=1454205 RepID=A0A9Q9SSM8_MOOP1|nr:hypothetical protein [Moorena producens]WAN68895.1 hypothetical protein BJP36_41770 [Moorena producens JHB]